MNTKKKSFYLLKALQIILFTMILAESHAMEVLMQSNDSESILVLKGEIKAGDLDKIKKVLLSTDIFPQTIMINSNGGSVIEAIDIGHLFKKLSVHITPIESCNSSCFLIIAGATDRELLSEIGLHRPYFSNKYNSKLSQVESESQYKVVKNMVRDYLLSMSIPTKYIDIMISTPSTDIYYLDKNEFRKNIGLTQPALYEWFNSKCGSLTKQEELVSGYMRSGDIFQSSQYFINKHVNGEIILSKEDHDDHKKNVADTLEDVTKMLSFPEKFLSALIKKKPLLSKCKYRVLSKERNLVLKAIKDELNREKSNEWTCEDFGITTCRK